VSDTAFVVMIKWVSKYIIVNPYCESILSVVDVCAGQINGVTNFEFTYTKSEQPANYQQFSKVMLVFLFDSFYNHVSMISAIPDLSPHQRKHPGSQCPVFPGGHPCE